MRASFVRFSIPVVLFLLTTIYLYLFISTGVRQTIRGNTIHITSLNTVEKICPTKVKKTIIPSSNETENKTNFLPGVSHEILRRRANNFIRESGYLINAALRKWKEDPSSISTDIEIVSTRFNELSRFLEADMEGLGRVDGAGAAKRVSLTRLSETLQKRLHDLQNPTSCNGKKFIVVDINKSCGFGCQMHHLIHCFVLAYANNRILILSERGWSYSKLGFTSVFEPLSNCSSSGPLIHWGFSGYENANAVFCPIVESMENSPPYINPAVPADLSAQLLHLHGNPPVWFVGQLLTYIMRLKMGNIPETINKIVVSFGDSPVVGIHVRRTDKINTEAKLHEIEEYMYHANQYFDKIDAQCLLSARKHEWIDDEPSTSAFSRNQCPVKRRFFIASDDSNLINEARRKFPNSIFMGDSNRSDSAKISSRFTHDGLLSIITDVLALSKTEFIVCTFSSQVCRLAYELMQTQAERLGDASERFHSLDDVYYYGGQQSNPIEVIVPDKEYNLSIGDLVTFHGNHWNGLAKVSMLNSSNSILVPAYKFQNRLLSVPFGPHLLNFASHLLNLKSVL